MGDRKQHSTRVKRAFESGELTDVTVLYGNQRAVIRGCRKILSYAPDEICVALRRRTIRLTGKELLFTSFAAGSATVQGTIRSVVLEPAGNREEEV